MTATPKEWGCSALAAARRRCPISSESSTKPRRDRPDDPTLAVELNNLAEAYRLLDRSDEAEALYLRAVELDEGWSEQRRGARDQPEQSRAGVPSAGPAGRGRAGPPPLAQPARGRRQPSHLDVARSLAICGHLPRAGQADRARPLQERAVAIAEASLGREHPTRSSFAATAEPDKPPAKESRRDATTVGAPPVPRSAPRRRPAETVREAALSPALPDPLPEPAAPAALARSTGRRSFAVQVAAVPERGQVAAGGRLAVRFPLLNGLELQRRIVEVAGKGTFTACSPARSARAPKRAVCERMRARPAGPAVWTWPRGGPRAVAAPARRAVRRRSRGRQRGPGGPRFPRHLAGRPTPSTATWPSRCERSVIGAAPSPRWRSVRGPGPHATARSSSPALAGPRRGARGGRLRPRRRRGDGLRTARPGVAFPGSSGTPCSPGTNPCRGSRPSWPAPPKRSASRRPCRRRASWNGSPTGCARARSRRPWCRRTGGDARWRRR